MPEMLTRVLRPHVMSCNASISACDKGVEWKAALALLLEMAVRGLQPNVISCNASISACEKGMEWSIALELLHEMPEKGLQPDVIIFNQSSVLARRVCMRDWLPVNEGSLPGAEDGPTAIDASHCESHGHET